MIKAVIFDFFGVLALRGFASFRQTYFPDNPEKTSEIKSLQDKLGLGLIGYNDFIDALALMAGIGRAEVLRYTENYQPNDELLEYISNTLKPKYKIGIISNAGDDWVAKILGDKNLKLFDDIILSYQVEVIKPEPQIYKMSADNLGIKAAESVFVDDIQTYCKGAENAGMKAIWYKSFEQAKKELEALLTVSKN